MPMNPRLLRPLARQAGALPPSTDPYFSSVSLLLHFDGANDSTTFVDSSSQQLTPTGSGNAKISTAQSKFGGSSLLLDGNGDLLIEESTEAFAIGDTFTVECWLYLLELPTGTDAAYITDFRDGDGLNYTLGVFSSSAVPYAYGGGSDLQGTESLTVATWHHIAYVNDGGDFAMYLDGVACGNTTLSHSQAAASVRIGSRYSEDVEFINGYIDELRITKGVARYTAAFTPPTEPFPNQ